MSITPSYYNRNMKIAFSTMVITSLIQVSIIVSLSPNAKAGEERWELIGKSMTDTLWYIDTETISQPSDDVVSVWVKCIPEKADTDFSEREETTEEILKKIQTRNFGDYGYTEGLWELECSKTMYRILYFCVYNRTGEIVTSTLTPDAEWSFIIPESVGETLLEAVCKR